MNTYMTNFIVYTFAMVGFIFLLFFIYRKSTSFSQLKNSKSFLGIETSMRLSPTKTIYVINAGVERFLVAADPSNTTMLAKLDNTNIIETGIVNDLSEKSDNKG